MANKFIVDTDVCLDFLKGQEYALSIIQELLIKENAYLSILTYYELLRGAYTKKQQKTVENFVNGFEVLNIDKEITKIGAKFYRDYRKKGITLSTVDTLIMATAKKYGLKIITRNVKHYPEKDLLSDFSKNLLLEK
ncbi:MAG TPA: type II toxin-antitoxin system VapC family toxin [Persephonella sp.]|nr:type II toxin-antitoxin system VapC family toxin [Persephonella sp.]